MFSLNPKSVALVLIDLQKGVLAMPVAPARRRGGDRQFGPARRGAEQGRRGRGAGPRGLFARRRRSAAPGGRPAEARRAAAAGLVRVRARNRRAAGRLRHRQTAVGRLSRNRARSAIAPPRRRHDRSDRRRHQFRRRTDGARSLADRLCVVVAEDAASSSAGEAAHRFAVETILPRISRVRSTDAILAALA